MKSRSDIKNVSQVSNNIHRYPCKKYDRDSHGNSISFHVTTRLGGSLVHMDTKFHDYSMSFTQVLFVFHAGTLYGLWTSSSHGISLAFAKKMMGFPVRIWSHFQSNCRQKDMRKSVLHFLQGTHLIYHILIVLS